MTMKISPLGPIKLLTEFSQGIGKTIARIDEEKVGGYWKEAFLVIRFTDGTAFLFAPASEDRFLPDLELLEGSYSFQREARVFFGLASLEEYEAKQAREKMIDEEMRARDDRATYERLKAKFEK